MFWGWIISCLGGGLSVKLGRERELSPLWTLVLAMSEPSTVQLPSSIQSYYDIIEALLSLLSKVRHSCIKQHYKKAKSCRQATNV